ncbi:MAG TPA: amino acid adenylation domain-containing protein [Planctomycetota bacterium]|nr:amino acid adenylation domain-containing protein [Planctomycetota bacterium]
MPDTAGTVTGVTVCVRHCVETFAERPALDGIGGLVTYRMLSQRAERLAQSLRAHGITSNARVALHAQRSPEAVIAVLGVLLAGGAYVPIDPTYPRDRRAYMLESSGARVLLTQRVLSGSLAAPGVSEILIDAEPSGGDSSPSADAPAADHLAYVIFTSGSTGRPKGIAMPHGPLANLIAWQNRVSSIGAGGRTLQFASLSFDVSFQELFATWTTGGCLVLIDERLRRDPTALLHFLAQERIDRLYLPFVALQQLAESARQVLGLSWSLREIITAGETLRITPALRAWFTRLPGCTLANQYGPSETHVVTSHELAGDPTRWPELPPIGKPITGARIHLLDIDRRSVGAGQSGELYVGGPVLAQGYLGRDDLTAERFVTAAPTGTDERLYRTGDLARVDANGDIEFLGRADDQVKIRGFRIEPGEIEAVLARHEAVAEAAVVAREFAPGDLRLVGYVVARPGAQPTPAALRAWCAATLADYQVPTAVAVLERFPLTPSGKVDRRALPAVTIDRSQLAAAYHAPTNDLERRLVTVWSDILRQPQIGRDDNFFDLGGTSLLLTQVHERLGRELARELPITLLFERPTVRSLAEALASDTVAAVAASAAERGVQQRNALLRQQQQLRSRSNQFKPRPQ